MEPRIQYCKTEDESRRGVAQWVPLGVAALTLLVWVALAGPALSAEPASELQPNLEALPADEFRLETDAGGRTYLRFSTTTWNSGLGPLELVAGEKDAAKQNIHQRIHLDDGSYYDRLAGTFVWHEEHGHFHFEDYALYTLQAANAPGASERTSSKTTFCVIDTDRINHRLPGAPKRSVYRTCASEIQGMSVGWGDTYRYYLAGQAIDVTDLPDGDYQLTIEVDPKNRLLETDDADNTSTMLLRISVNDGTLGVLGGGASGPGNGNGRGNGRGPR